MRFLPMVLASMALASSAAAQPAAVRRVDNPVVVLFIVDGIDLNTIRTAVASGAKTTATVLKDGVTVERFLCTSPAGRLQMPDGSLPWGGSTSANVALHTGTHIFESKQIDDIFLSARRAGIKSVFAGGSVNYKIFDTADFLYFGGNELTDESVVDLGLQHFQKDGARLLRLHPQHIRNAWSGPGDTTNPRSAYIQYYVNTVDPLLAKLINGLKTAGAWERTYLILSSDHGMGQTSQSGHPQSVLSSWVTFAAFAGPGIKKGQTIPYAEGPDIAVMANHFLGLPPLRGHLDGKVPPRLRRVTGTLLANVFEGGPADVKHPRLIQRFLDAGLPGDAYVEYRDRMIKLLQ